MADTELLDAAYGMGSAARMFQPGTVWRHYKGGRYEVVCLAIDEGTMKTRIVYRDLDRPIMVWDREVWGPNGWTSMVILNDGSTMQRFTRVRDAL